MAFWVIQPHYLKFIDTESKNLHKISTLLPSHPTFTYFLKLKPLHPREPFDRTTTILNLETRWEHKCRESEGYKIQDELKPSLFFFTFCISYFIYSFNEWLLSVFYVQDTAVRTRGEGEHFEMSTLGGRLVLGSVPTSIGLKSKWVQSTQKTKHQAIFRWRGTNIKSKIPNIYCLCQNFIYSQPYRQERSKCVFFASLLPELRALSQI